MLLLNQRSMSCADQVFKLQCGQFVFEGSPRPRNGRLGDARHNPKTKPSFTILFNLIFIKYCDLLALQIDLFVLRYKELVLQRIVGVSGYPSVSWYPDALITQNGYCSRRSARSGRPVRYTRSRRRRTYE